MIKVIPVAVFGNYLNYIMEKIFLQEKSPHFKQAYSFFQPAYKAGQTFPVLRHLRYFRYR